MLKTPRLSVVGAGPGDIELITLKAIKVLGDADVVLYDALVDTALLNYAPDAEHIYVGKRKGCYAYQQEQINELIVSRANTHGHVVRLKGGDPMVFGRGAEEMEYASRFGLETYMVPGISSCMAVPASQDIPVTKRGIAESFWVITATTRNHQISKDIFLAAKSNATIVILMGMSKLEHIVEIFKAEGKEDLPVGIIQNGTRADENIGIGKISNITEVVAEKSLKNPAIIIIGEVVEQREKMIRLREQMAYKETAQWQ